MDTSILGAMNKGVCSLPRPGNEQTLIINFFEKITE